jgi:hypothetical protein
LVYVINEVIFVMVIPYLFFELGTECGCSYNVRPPNKYLFGGVVVSVLDTGPKGHGFKPGRSDGFLRAIKIRSTPSFGWEVKPEVPCRNIFVNSSYFPQMTLLV